MKKLCLAVVMLLAGVQGVKAADLNLFNFPGMMWGRFDQRMSAGNNNAGQTRFGRLQGILEQGIQLKSFPHLYPYVAGNLYQPLAQAQDSYLAYGLKNTTLIPSLINPLLSKAHLANIHGSLGVEHQDSSVFNNTTPVASRTVGFVQLYMEWGTGGDNLSK